MTHEDIEVRRREINKVERNRVRDALDVVDEQNEAEFGEEIRQLEEACEKLGHNWQPLGMSHLFVESARICPHCGMTKVGWDDHRREG